MYTFSDEHKLYISKIKKDKFIVRFFRFTIFILFIIIWELLTYFNIINSFLYSSPTRIIRMIIFLIFNNNLFNHILVTISEVLLSFFISMLLGIIIASILWSKELLFKCFDPFITIINSLPKVALGPLIIIWVGASINSIIFMSVTISLFTTILTIYSGFSSVNYNYIVMLKSFGATKYQIFKKVILPSNIDNLASCIKINISMSLIGVIMGELLVSKSGLGYLIMYGSQVFNLDLVITSIFILAIISYLMYIFLDLSIIIIKKRN